MAERSQEQLQRRISPSTDHLLKVADSAAPAVSKKSDGNTTFLRAARSGNLEKVLEFINANVDINTSNSNGLNALHLASKDGHKEVVAELLKRGANVDAATKKGNTALHIASLAGQEEVVKLLVENGASVNVQSQSGFTPLYMAAQENHERVVRYLLNNGANQSLATEDGFTPLAVAMQQGHEKVVTELLENDTRGKIRLPALHIAAKKDDCKAAALLLQSEHNNPDITSKSGFTPLHIASHYGNDGIASLLLAKGADVNYAAKHNITPLHVAAKWGRNNMVLLLLDKGASIVAKTRDGLTPLHCAARSGHEQVVDTLLQRHAPITAKTKNGLAPLHMASQGDHVEAARVLLQHRAPVDDVTVDYLTALHVASHCGHVSVAKLLLDRKADPNARALNGFTPLHIACKKNRVKVVELLLKHGASIESTTESGLSPLHVASFMGCMNIVIYLLQCEANPDVSTIRGETPLHLASRANQTDIIRILLRNGAQVDAKAREQQTPLHIASRLGNQDIVMLLLQHGASVDSVTKDQYTSLHIAAKEDQEEVAQVLLDNNASMTATTKKGFTPLHLASKYGRTKIATLLLHRGAPVDAQGKNGVTPLHVASHYDHQGIALLLLDKGASPHAIAKNGHTPLHIAGKKNQMDIAAMLLEYGASAEVESKAGFTPLHLSAQEGHAEMTNLLLEHKSDVNHSSKNGLTPLHLCAQEDCVEVAKILVQNGADINAVTKAGYTPLHIASHFGQLNMVRYLLSQKVKVDCTTSTGYTPLHQAAQQGNSAIVAVLLDNGASPDSKNNQGQTALCIAQKLGYISVVEVLKNVTEASKAPVAAAGNEEKYKVVAPETMQENFMSDSEDEGGDDVVNEQSYRYLTIDEMKSLGDDSLPLDVTREDRYDTTAGIDESISPQHTYSQMNAAPPALDNVDVSRGPIVQSGFLVSFLVDAKGGAMRGCRHSGVRVIVPPQCVTMPTRVTCRYVRRDKPNHPPPPPLMEGEALASRILELGPVGVKFLGPVVIEVPNFAALRGNEREIVILRSDNGETWREHTIDSSNEAVQEILSRSFDKDGNQIQVDEPGRITSIVTNDFPHYFAVVSRIRQEVHAIGPEGGMVSSSVVPQVQAVFPPGALTKKIKVGLQAQPIPSDLTAAVLGNCVAVSPIVTIEPRRRKFHKPITLTLPVPQAANKGMINQYSGDAPTLRLLCSITGGTSRAQWEDVTGSTPLTFVKECVSFTTTVSARFWLMDVRDIAVATKKATELYREAIHIPFMAKFVVFAKRVDNNEARLRVFCMTDDKEDKTLECQEHFIEVAKSRDVEVLEGKQQLVELSGNLISVTKSGDQLRLGFHAFQENRLPFTVRLKDSHSDPIGRMLFFKEQKPVKMSTPHPPVCVLNIVLPDGIVPDHDLLDSPMRNYSYSNDVQGYHRSELRFSDISNLIGEDWLPLSEKLGINSAEAAVIRSEYPESVPKQALTMLRIWHQEAGSKASANILESALLSIGRDDIVQECILNTPDMSKKKLFENSMQPSKSVMSEIIEDYQIRKHDISSTDDDEKKYTAEEKVVLDDEPKKSVSERKTEIEKRLKSEPSKRLSKELPSESIEKRNSLEKEPVIKRQSSQSKDVIKSSEVSSNVDGNETFEPTTLTFEQKRLSFERGLSFDKGVVPDISKESSVDKFIQIEKNEPRHDVKSTVVKEEKIMQIDKANLKIDKPGQNEAEEIKSNEPVEHFHIIKEVKPIAKDSGDQFVQKEKELSFAEKRLSFELGGDAKVPACDLKSTEKTKADDASHLTKSEGERRDSELFEGVSLGLGKLEAKTTATEQNFLSPKPYKTPPPSPAEFKSESWKKQDSEESNKSEALPDKRTTEVTESSSKSSDHSSDETVYVVKKRKCLLKDGDDLRRRIRLDDKLSVRRKRNALEAFCERYRYNRYPFEVDVDTSSSISSNLRSISKSSLSSFGSYSHSINYAGDKLNMVSFKKQFAASCLPSSVWNRSLPNISFSMMSSSTSLLLSPSSSSYHTNEFFIDEYPLPHCSSVEYFTPERNYTPKCGAYCKWLPGDDLSEEITDHPRQLQPVSKICDTSTTVTPEENVAVVISTETCDISVPILKNDIDLISKSNRDDKLESSFVVETDNDSIPVKQLNVHSITHVKTIVDSSSPVKQKHDSCTNNNVTHDTTDVISGVQKATSHAKNVTPVTSFQPVENVKTMLIDSFAAKHDIDESTVPQEVDDSNESSSVDSISSIRHIAVPTSEVSVGADSVDTIETTIIETTSIVKDGSKLSPDTVVVIQSTESIPATKIEADLIVGAKSVPVAENSTHLTTAIVDDLNSASNSRLMSEPTSDSGDTSSNIKPIVASPRCEFIKSESICEITYEDENAFYKEGEHIGLPIEPITINYETTEELIPDHNEIDFEQDEARRNELIDLLIEKENAKLIASGILGYDSDDSDEEESDENNESEPRVHLQHQTAICGVDSDDDNLEHENVSSNGLNGSSGTHKKDSVSKQNTYDMIEEHCVLRDSPRSYHKFGEASGPISAQSEHHHVESSERSPQRKVAFRLNSADDDLVYPGQTDSEECNSSSENSEETNDNSVEERLENEEVSETPLVFPVESPKVTYIGSPTVTSVTTVTKTTTTIVANPQDGGKNIVTTIVSSSSNFKPTSEVERKFERMASESLDECGPVAEGEFQKIVSQLSVEEVDDCLNEWNETQKAAISDDKSSRLEGDKRQHSYAEKETPPVNTPDDVPKVDTDKRECTDYFSKKKFWQSFESTTTTTNTVGPDSKLAAPVPKPRASICVSGLTDSLDSAPSPPTVSRRSSENISRLSMPPAQKGKVVNKSESEDNVLLVAATEGASTRTKPSMRQMHSLTTCSVDSEAEYVASCGVEKLAFENMAFSEEDENRDINIEPATDSGNVKAKKMFFEQQINSSLDDNTTHLPKEISGIKHHLEEHLDKSEVESSEKKKQSSIEDIEDPSTATPIDILLTNGCSVEGSADSTRSESDFTPEELRSVSDLSAEAISESVGLKSLPKSDSDQSISEVNKELGERSVITDIEQSSQKVELFATSAAKSSSLKEVTQPEAKKSITDAQKTESIQKLPDDKLNHGETVKSSIFINKLPSDIGMPMKEAKQDESLKKIENSSVSESFQFTNIEEFSVDDSNERKLTSIAKKVDQKSEDLKKQAIGEKLGPVEMNSQMRNATDYVVGEVPVSIFQTPQISGTAVISKDENCPQMILDKSVGSSSDSLAKLDIDTKKDIISDLMTEHIATLKNNKKISETKIDQDNKSDGFSVNLSSEHKFCEPSQRTDQAASTYKIIGPSKSTDKDSVANLTLVDQQESRGKTDPIIENIDICIDSKISGTPAFPGTACERKSFEDSKRYIGPSSKAENSETIEKSIQETKELITTQKKETEIFEQSQNISSPIIQKSVSTEESQTILERVITSQIPVTSVITTKRISIGDSSHVDSLDAPKSQIKEEMISSIPDTKNYSEILSELEPAISKKAPIKDLDEYTIEKKCDSSPITKSLVAPEKEQSVESTVSKVYVESKVVEKPTEKKEILLNSATTTEQIIMEKSSSLAEKTISITETIDNLASKPICIEKVDTVDSQTFGLPANETTKTTTIISEESGKFIETRTIEEKVILSPTTIFAPLTSVETEHSVDEFPVKISKKTTEVTSSTSSGLLEKSFPVKEIEDSSILTDSSSNTIIKDDDIYIGHQVKSEEVEKTQKEIIPRFSVPVDTAVPIKQTEEIATNLPQLTNKLSESIFSNQPEKAVSKIPKPQESFPSTAEKPLITPTKPVSLSGANLEKSFNKDSRNEDTVPISSCEISTKENTSLLVSKIPKPESIPKTTSGSNEVVISSSMAESNLPSKDIKTSSVKESRIPIRKMISREKSNESIKSVKSSMKVAAVTYEQLESISVIQPESKSIAKDFEAESSEISDEVNCTGLPIESSLKIETVSGKEKCKLLPTMQSSKSTTSAELDLSSMKNETEDSVSHRQFKPVEGSEHCDISSDIKVCDKQFLSSSSIHEDNSSREDDISDEQIVTYGYSDKRISITEDEAKIVAENLIDEIETELNQRPDLVENLLLSQMDLLCQDTNDLVADDSNDITDEDLRSTGTEVDIAMPECSDFSKQLYNTSLESSKSAEIKISEASPTEYEIKYEQVEEFKIPESADFEEHIITEGGDPDKEDSKDISFALESKLEHTAAKPPIPDSMRKPVASSVTPEVRRKSSEESAPRTDILSPESGSSDTPSKRYEDATSSPTLVVTRIKKNHDIDLCSSSSESHYHSFTSRPCSSDIEGMLSLSAVPGSSEYETAVSRNTSSYSHEFHTAISSASIHDSLKSIDSESSGHLGSAEISSEISETLVPSCGDLEHDIDFPGGINVLYDDTPKNIYSKTFLEPYDQDIPINIIKGTIMTDSKGLEQTTYKADATYNPLLDERLESSCEDMSSLSITDGGANVQTIVEVPGAESDKMDNSLLSEQTSLTMSAISNQLSTSSSDFKDEVETDRKTVDTNTICTSQPSPVGPGITTSVTLLTSVSEDQGRHNVNTQVTSNIEPSIKDSFKSPDISPDGESFELIEKPDLLDDFVVIEEVAKEACEFDPEGRSICIMEKRKSSNFDDDILLPPPQMASTLTHVEYYEPSSSAGDEACSFERVIFEEKQTSNQLYEHSPPNDAELYAREVEEGKKWIEMQFQTDSETTAYEYGYERAPLEDIKEEDTDDMQSSKVGSVSSQISQSIGSLGSMKQSLSSTPDYDILAGKRYFSKSAEPDTVSQGSLQEFERLEQLMALESMKGKLSASQDSISSGSNEKKCSIAGDDVSVSSLKEFEGLELACGEMDKIEERAKAEEHCLSQIEEGHESQASESESCETLEKSCYESDVDEDDYDKKMFEIDEIIRQAQSNVEKFAERLEKTESLGRGDSFEETSRIPELEFDLPLTDPPTAIQHASVDLYSGKKYIENVDLSHSLTESTDSLELKPGSNTSKYLDDQVTSTDSLEGGGSSGGKSKLDIASDSLDNRAESPRSEATEVLVHDEFDSSSVYRLSPNQISSPDSADATSSTATHATYQNDSLMSSSFTSVDSNTMVSSTENLEHVVSNYSCWLEGGQQSTSITTTKHSESSNEGFETQVSTTRRTVEMPVEVEGVKVVYKGPQAKKMLEQEIASFKPGEYVTETREVDSEGRVRVRRVIETRTVLTSEQVESGRTSIKMGRIVGDISGGSGSCSKVTSSIMQSNLTLAGSASESSSEQEKKKDTSEDTSKGVKKKTK